MMKHESRALRELWVNIQQCRKCHLSKLEINTFNCDNHGKVVGYGKNYELAFFGQNPSYYRLSNLRAFSEYSRGNIRFLKALEELGYKREDIFIDNIVKCSTMNNSAFNDVEIQACSFWLLRELEIIQPKIIVAMGKFAIDFFDSKLGAFTEYNRYRVFGIFHPAYMSRTNKGREKNREWLKEIVRSIK